MNFNNYRNEPPGGGGGASGGSGKPPNIFSLARQSSVYSLTFDEFQSTMGGSIGKDFGSMNMDELLKNIWTAEETQQTTGATSVFGSVGQEGSSVPSNYLQRQGSITLPRTLSQKTVDEVWKDLSGAGMKLPVRQQTLGEVTLEEFLFRAGVVSEEAKLPEKPQNFDLLGDLTRPVGNQALGFAFQQMSQNTGITGNRVLESNIQPVLVSNRVLESNNQSALQPVNGVRQPQPLPIFPKQPILPYANPIPIPNGTQIDSPGIRGGIMGISDPMVNGNLGQNGGLGMFGMGANGVTVATGSPTLSSDGIGRTNGDTSSVSPVPYVFTSGLRGRRSNNAVEKVIERRQRRMIKNRESAARSRARKQAYTTELEAEVAKLKEENQELQKKQAEIMEMQKNKVFEMINMQQGGKRRRLNRTQTGPW